MLISISFSHFWPSKIYHQYDFRISYWFRKRKGMSILFIILLLERYSNDCRTRKQHDFHHNKHSFWNVVKQKTLNFCLKFEKRNGFGVLSIFSVNFLQAPFSVNSFLKLNLFRLNVSTHKRKFIPNASATSFDK